MALPLHQVNRCNGKAIAFQLLLKVIYASHYP